MLLYQLADHLWQSTLFAVAAAVAAGLLRRERAQWRYVVWLLAAFRFLIPVAWLTNWTERVEWGPASLAAHAVIESAGGLAAPFSAPLSNQQGVAEMLTPAAGSADWAVALLVIWTSGTLLFLGGLLGAWLRIARIAREAEQRQHGLSAPIPIRFTRTRLEPGLWGFRHPVILLPHDLDTRLSRAQITTVVTHEVAHWRRRDNWTALVPMLTTALFWFHPLTWWIARRMWIERERACDEAVIAAGGAREDYAKGIFAVCRGYFESPLACAAGATGGELARRIRGILLDPLPGNPHWGKQLALAAGLASLAVWPVSAGFRFQAIDDPAPHFEVAAIRPNHESNPPFRLLQGTGGRVTSSGLTVANYIAFAYDVEDFQISGPAWIKRDRFNLDGKLAGVDTPATNAQFRRAFQPLLRDRFGLRLHEENREGSVYLMRVVDGKKLKPHTGGERGTRAGVSRTSFHGTNVRIEDLAGRLSIAVGRPVLDRTGLKGGYDLDLEWSLDLEESSNAARPGLLTAIREQLGLRLDAGRGPIRHLAVDEIHRPTEN